MATDCLHIVDRPWTQFGSGTTFIPGTIDSDTRLHRQPFPKHLSEMDSFEYNSVPSRVIFGSGELKKLPAELNRLKLLSPLLLSTPRQIGLIDNLKYNLENHQIKCAGIFDEAAMHTPTNVTDRAMIVTKSSNADCVVSIGGGSTIGLGKAISVRTGLPHICIPTTYAGSEMTPILGETADGVKKTRTDPKILPGTVIYDVDLTMALPSSISATSGINAIAHGGMSLGSDLCSDIV